MHILKKSDLKLFQSITTGHKFKKSKKTNVEREEEMGDGEREGEKEEIRNSLQILIQS